MSRKYQRTKEKTKEQFYIAKLRTMGYSLNHFDDNGETKVLSEFERRLPLKLVPLDQYDGFLQQIQGIKGSNSVKLESLL